MSKAKINKDYANTVCEACGAKFGCKVNDIANCFCTKINLSKASLLQIKSKYANCLCKTCLRKLKGNC